MNPKKILISKADRRLMDDIRMTIERPNIPDWNLHIRNVRYTDSGMYTCTLNTRPVLIKRIYLTVLGECRDTFVLLQPIVLYKIKTVLFFTNDWLID